MQSLNNINKLPAQWQLLISLLTACLLSTQIFAAGNNNAPLRKAKITAIVLHAIGGPVCKHNRVAFTPAPGNALSWKEWFERQKSVSIHYVVDRVGQIAQSIDENRVAWHANNYNRYSIGIELVNNGDGIEPYPQQQLAALADLVRQILTRYKSIGINGIVRHSDIDSRTFNCGGKRVDLKQDPGSLFPFENFKAKLK